jgi:sugar phosphate isomerase/epimerase
MNAASPRYAVNATSLPHSTVWQDIDDIAATGAEGIGLWERKLPDGADADVAARLSEAGLAATYCVPALHCVLPSQVDPPGAPQDGPTRRALIAASIRRLAAFRPAAVLIAPGASGDPAHPAGPVEAVADALPELADVAASCGVPIGVELLAARRGATISSLPGLVALLDDIGLDNLGVMFSVFHSWSEPDLHENLLRYGHRINSVQVCDVREQERSPFDRELPGRGRGVAPGIMATLLRAGYRGWWELEIFSDDGTYGTALPDSYWAMPPRDFLARAKKAFDESYALATSRGSKELKRLFRTEAGTLPPFGITCLSFLALPVPSCRRPVRTRRSGRPAEARRAGTCPHRRGSGR